MKLYIVTGGIGKHAVFSSMIEPLADMHGENISVMSAYPDIFKFHPRVDKSVSHIEPGFYEEVVTKPDTEIFHAEPYYSNYAKGRSHLATEWAKMHGIPNADTMPVNPDIWVDDFAVAEAERFKATHRRFIITQFSGGQSPIGMDQNKQHFNLGQMRDYPRHLAQEVVDRIKQRHGDVLTILNYALPNEQSADLDGTISIQAPYLFYVALLQMASGYVAIDSSLQHFAANKWNQRRGVVIWGSTGPVSLGYEKNMNLTNAKAHNIRPLTRSLGDVFNKDGSQWRNRDTSATHVDPLDVVEALDHCMNENAGLDVSFDNSVKVEKKERPIIGLDANTSQLLLGLIAQSNGLSAQADKIVARYVKARGMEGNYAVSEDGTHLIRIS